MAKRVIDADTILNQAKPSTHQHAHEIHPFGHLVKLPIALAENVCRESVDNLNQLLADTMTLRDLGALLTSLRATDRMCCFISLMRVSTSLSPPGSFSLVAMTASFLFRLRCSGRLFRH